MKRSRGGSGTRSRKPPRSREPFEVGRKVRDPRGDRVGTILDVARQYAHPKADPVFNYLIRWDDGQVQAFSEAAFGGGQGFELLED